MMSMGPPPMLPGYSLRVQLFAPNAHAANDTPVRCFRVVTSPDATLREFCEEATRIHAANYGQSISIKKCQDDQLFDVTQGDLIGSIFPNASTIRMIQASNVPSNRDSVPPTSALSYDPANILGKRKRLESPILNGSGPPNPWKVNKRLRLFDIDPDQPIQSLEYDTAMNENMQEDDVVPDSQENGSLIVTHGHPERQSVRLSTVPETPAVFPFPSLPAETDRILSKSAFPILHSPYHEPLIRPSTNGSRAKSATYHIPRLEERGISVFTAATTPLDTDQQLELPPRNLSKDCPHSSAQNSKNRNRSGNEDSIYDDVASDQESIPGLWRTRAALKIRNNWRTSLPGPSQGNKPDTPPTGSRRHSSQLLLTPSSRTKKAVETGEGQNNQDSARAAAAKAAEQRRQVQAAEAQRIQEQEQAASELKLEDEAEGERLEMKKADETGAEELTTAAVKAEQIRKKQEEKKTAVAMKRMLETERLHKESEDKEAAAAREKFLKAERLEQETKEEQASRERKLTLECRAAAIVQKNLNEKKVKEELAAVAKAENLRLRLEREDKRAAAAAEKREALELKLSRTKAAALSKKKSSSPETEASDLKAAMIRPQSATPFIPRGRSASRQSPIKSALKSSSPEFSRGSPQVQRRGVLADQCSLPSEKTSTPQVSLQPIFVTPVPPPSSLRIAKSVDKPQKERERIPIVEIPTFTPPRRSAKRVTVEVPTETASSQRRSSPTPALPTRKRATPTASMSRTMARPLRASESGSSVNATTNANSKSLERSKPVERQSVNTEIVNSSDDEMDSSDDHSEDLYEGDKTHEEDHVQKPASEELPSNKSTASVAASIKATQQEVDSLKQTDVDVEIEDHVEDDLIQAQDEDDEDGEMTSCHSSPRESRSPVVFNRHDMSQKSIMSPLPPRSAQATRAASANSITSSISVMEETLNFQGDGYGGDQEEEKDTEESEEGDESESESLSSNAENVEEDCASPDLPSHNSRGHPISSPSLRSQRLQPLSPSRTQDEIDQRLTADIHKAYAARTPSQSQPKRSLSGLATRPTQKLHPRPAMRNGVSLSAMKSGIVGSYRSRVAIPYVDRTRNAAAAMARLQEQEYVSENEDSYSDSDSSRSDNDEVIPAIAATKSSQAKTKAGSNDSDDSDDSVNEHNQALDLISQQPSSAASQQTMNQRKQTTSKSQRKRLVSKKAGEDMRGKTSDRVISGYSFARPP